MAAIVTQRKENCNTGGFFFVSKNIRILGNGLGIQNIAAVMDFLFKCCKMLTLFTVSFVRFFCVNIIIM